MLSFKAVEKLLFGRAELRELVDSLVRTQSPSWVEAAVWDRGERDHLLELVESGFY